MNELILHQNTHEQDNNVEDLDDITLLKLQELRGHILLFRVKLLQEFNGMGSTINEILISTLSKLSALANIINTIKKEDIHLPEYQESIQDGVKEVNKGLKDLYKECGIDGPILEPGDIFGARKNVLDEQKQLGLSESGDAFGQREKRLEALEQVALSDSGFSSLHNQRSVLNKLDTILKGDAANEDSYARAGSHREASNETNMLEGDITEFDARNSSFDASWQTNRDSLLAAIKQAKTTRDASSAMRISKFIQMHSGKTKTREAAKEESSILYKHLSNLRPGSPIVINTLEQGSITVVAAQKQMRKTEKEGEYYKLSIVLPNNEKKIILLNMDDAVVGDLSAKYKGEFDEKGQFTIKQQDFTILSIRSNKLQDEKAKPTFKAKVSESIRGLGSRLMNIIGR